MPKVIRNGRIVADDWEIVVVPQGTAASTVAIPAQRAIVPLAVWRAQRETLTTREDVGVWLDGDDDPSELGGDLGRLPLVAIHFAKFADGRGYSSAVLLRTRYHFNGELRAIGEVLRDQFNYLTRCGFDVLQPPEGHYTNVQLEAAVASLTDFSEPYQGTAAPAQPLFRRVRRAA